MSLRARSLPRAGRARDRPPPASTLPAPRALGTRWPLVVTGIVLLAVALRLPGLLEPRHYTDEGVFAAVAQRLLQGHTLYTNAWDDKPPLIFWLYACVLAVAGPSMVVLRALAALWVAAGVAGVALCGRRLLGDRAGLAAALVSAVLMALPLVEANLASTELFAATPVIWAMALLARPGPARTRDALLAGSLLGAAALFKQVAAFDAAAALLFLLLQGRTGARTAAALIVGALVPALAVALVLLAQGALTAGAYAMAGFYFDVYLREGSGLPAWSLALRSAPLAAGSIAAALAARRGQGGASTLLPLWLGWASTAAMLPGRPYGHYLVLTLAPAALALVALVASRGRAARVALASVTTLAALAVALSFARFWGSYEMVRPAYAANVAGYLIGTRDRDTYERFFSWRVAHERRLAALIRADGVAERTLFVWGEYPWLYLGVGAENPTRYVTSYLTSFVPGAKVEVMGTLRRDPPHYLVWERTEWRRLPGLADLVAERYDLVARVDTTELYRRKDAVP